MRKKWDVIPVWVLKSDYGNSEYFSPNTLPKNIAFSGVDHLYMVICVICRSTKSDDKPTKPPLGVCVGSEVNGKQGTRYK